MVERTAVFPAGRHSLYAEHRYSAAIRSGDLLFVSGQVGSREDGTPEPDFQQQVRLAFDNLHATLAAAGCTFDDIIDVTSFHTDPENQFEDIMTVKNEMDRVGSPLTSSSQGQLIPTLIPPTGQCAICCIVLWPSKDMGNRKRSLVWSHG